MADEEKNAKVGSMLRGQAWVELHGVFVPDELRSIAQEIERQCQGLEKKDVNKG